MTYQLLFTNEAGEDLDKLEQNPNLQKRLKAVRKALAYLETNPRHPSLKTHKYDLLSREIGIEVFEAYAENKTSVAYQIFWYYGPDRKNITILAITPHP